MDEEKKEQQSADLQQERADEQESEKENREHVGRRFAPEAPKKSKKPILIAILIVCVIALCGGGFYFYSMNQKINAVLASDGIYSGITIEGIDVSGLSEAEAAQKLEEEFGDDTDAQKLTLVYGEEKRIISFADIDAGFHIADAVREAYETGRNGTDKENRHAVKELLTDGKDISMEYSYDEALLRAELEKIAEELDQEPKDSQISRKNGAFVITEEEMGTKLNVEETIAAADAIILSRQSGALTAVLEETEPKVKKEDNEQITDLIGSFYTTYTAYDVNRNTNLEVGCRYINGTIVMPDEVFSVSEGLGEQTYENGYRSAGVYVNGKVENGMGGGVCQISTTIYNAAIMAELEIVERHPHSMTVGYVPLGRDAAIADGYKDLQIKNNTGYPIYIESYASGGKLVVNIYGKELHDATRSVEFETVYEATIAKPAEIITEDPERPEGEREVTHTGRTGCKVSVYKKVYENGTLISKDWFSSSSYRAVADEVTVGTKKTEEVPASSTVEPGGESVQPGVPSTSTDTESQTVPSQDTSAQESDAQ